MKALLLILDHVAIVEAHINLESALLMANNALNAVNCEPDNENQTQNRADNLDSKTQTTDS